MPNTTLHIIGNGFDLAHGLKTSYRDFREWICAHKKEFPINEFFLAEAFGCTSDELWSDFETVLGQMNPVTYLQGIYQDYENEEMEDQSEQVSSYIMSNFGSTFEKVIEGFRKWARHINVAEAESKIRELENLFQFDTNGLFVNFNYTNTLERVYQIPRQSILHIHGDAEDKNSQIIVGHDTDYKQYEKPLETYIDKIGILNYSDIKPFLIQDLINLRKPIEQKTGVCNAFLGNNEIDHIVVLGLSFGEVDFPYLKNIAERYPNALWTISIHDDEDENKVNTMAQRLGVHATLVEW